MARVVRNFWIEIDVAGRKTRVKCGGKMFGMVIYQREQGRISDETTVVVGQVEPTKLGDYLVVRATTKTGKSIETRTLR